MDWAYLAGFTDGDGCITREIKKGRYRYARIRWNQKTSDSYVLDEIATFLRSRGFKVTDRNFSQALKGHKFPQRELGITNAEDTRRILLELLPHLIVKQQRAREALAILNEVYRLKEQFGWKYRAPNHPVLERRRANGQTTFGKRSEIRIAEAETGE